ncbi:efflux RND transporter periplasmic adaptor subunit [Paucibacter sp. R3-3]|uniref:Efflux RND transporter periplasmic adaptor subunit n=1 Tax=Roseateles agri TaxID=3098619 RepID=A0ABU5DQH9_9BURK|nr:efflux RND transporter periplasmic adaptor subunit [Paucibacter sp. R3-3]MDY0747978.1 efflux RND transporter periplasmic adaptor subunit [Paucibacter sp. R3-3]
MSSDPHSMPAEPATFSRRKLQLSAIVIALAAVGIAAFGIIARRSDAAMLDQRAQDMAVPTVSVIAPKPSSGATALELPGRIEAFARAPIYARVSGYLKSWKVDIGAPVKAGQLLAEIETPDLDQQLLQAQAELASAKANASQAATTAKRWQSLLGSDSVSRQEVEERTNDLTAKNAAVKASQANVDRIQSLKTYTRITAPFDGVVTTRNTDVGALINVGSGAPGTELFVVSDTRKLRVYVTVPQTYAAAIKTGGKARLSVPEQPGKSYAATVQTTSRAISAGSGGMLVQLAVDNSAGELLPGGSAQVSLDQPGLSGTLAIPPGALIFNKAGLSVATVGADSKVQLKPVTVARDLGSSIEVATGLAAGDKVIENPPDGVSSGDTVRVNAKGG